jgi:hypothetical protein
MTTINHTSWTYAGHQKFKTSYHGGHGVIGLWLPDSAVPGHLEYVHEFDRTHWKPTGNGIAGRSGPEVPYAVAEGKEGAE